MTEHVIGTRPLDGTLRNPVIADQRGRPEPFSGPPHPNPCPETAARARRLAEAFPRPRPAVVLVSVVAVRTPGAPITAESAAASLWDGLRLPLDEGFKLLPGTALTLEASAD